MKKITLSLGKFQAVTKYGVSLLFWVALLILLALELFVVLNAYRIVQRSQEVPTLTVTRQVRFNFSQYDQAVKKIESGDTYLPPEDTGPSPFRENDVQ